MNLHEQLYSALKNGDIKKAIDARYKIAFDGEIVHIDNQDFSGCHIHKLPGDFIFFNNCKLTGTNFKETQFFPTYFKDCDMRDVDLSRVWGIMYAWNCDLRGANFEEANFNPKNHTTSPSAFKDCQLDPEFRQYLEEQDCRFDLEPHIIKFDMNLNQ